MKPWQVLTGAIAAAAAIYAIVAAVTDKADSSEQRRDTAGTAVMPATPAGPVSPPADIDPRPPPAARYVKPIPELPALPPPWETTIEFPDGSTVDVTMKPYRPNPPPFMGWQKLIHVYDTLVEEAEAGDAAAARVLYRSLRNCEEAYTDNESFQQALRTLHEEGIQVYPSGATFPQKMIRGSAEMKLAEEIMTESFEMCEGITEEHQQNKIQWAEMAAHRGDYWSMQVMAHERGYTPEGLYWHEQAWQLGYAGAADSLSIYYRSGAADPDNGQPDYFLSYAYLYVNYKVYAAALSQSSSPQAMNRIVSMENVVRQHGSFLSPEQQAQAESLAARLLEENDNCCLGGWQAIAR